MTAAGERRDGGMMQMAEEATSEIRGKERDGFKSEKSY